MRRLLIIFLLLLGLFILPETIGYIICYNFLPGVTGFFIYLFTGLLTCFIAFIALIILMLILAGLIESITRICEGIYNLSNKIDKKILDKEKVLRENSTNILK